MRWECGSVRLFRWASGRVGTDGVWLGRDREVGRGGSWGNGVSEEEVRRNDVPIQAVLSARRPNADQSCSQRASYSISASRPPKKLKPKSEEQEHRTLRTNEQKPPQFSLSLLLRPTRCSHLNDLIAREKGRVGI